ncbi:anti-sigma factor [Pseudoroseicyclus aestuarii]|uniref:Anti-sigma-K factor RskA n=1 Tax=Pseudoroseicyclus aestuarii TaxID=1795041 RepID=A0A318SNU8_9RHOB|nr:anti-sigma factor [Pseudoroseicyclus aestuarii]PYE82504.1 anti-sigma-K factor RskA [Pseudoroseicyclus aestuarii]
MSGAGPEDRDHDSVLAAEHVLGLLGAEEAAEADRRLQTDSGFRALHRDWTERMAGVAAAVPPVEAPRRLRRRIQQRLFGGGARPLWRRLGVGTALGGALAAALVALLVSEAGLLTPQREALPGLRTEIASADGTVLIEARIDAAASALDLAIDAEGPPAGRAHQLWLIPESGEPISLAVISEVQPEIVLPFEPDLLPLMPGATLAISDEPAGGSPTGAPTGAVLASGTLPEEAG